MSLPAYALIDFLLTVLDDGGLRGGVHGAEGHDLTRGYTSLRVDGAAEQGRRSKVSEELTARARVSTIVICSLARADSALCLALFTR